jgi:hypothetical protein
VTTTNITNVVGVKVAVSHFGKQLFCHQIVSLKKGTKILPLVRYVTLIKDS